MTVRQERIYTLVPVLQEDGSVAFMSPVLQEDWTAEEAEALIEYERQNVQSVPSYVERMSKKTGCPILFDTERI